MWIPIGAAFGLLVIIGWIIETFSQPMTDLTKKGYIVVLTMIGIGLLACLVLYLLGSSLH